MNKYKVVLFDDSKRIRESIKMLLDSSNDFELQKAYADASDAPEQLKVWKPDLVLMDIDMPGINGMDAVLRIRNADLHMPVIMLTVFDDAERVFQSLRNGAMGYLLKNTPPDKFLDALREVMEGGAPMTPSIARKVMFHFQSEQQQTTDYNLSDREKEVLKLLVEGKSYKMIAADLNIGFETVRTYIKRIYDKLHVQSMTEAVAKSIKERLV